MTEDAAMECSLPEKLDIEKLNAVLKIDLDGSAKSEIVAHQQRKLIGEIINYVGEDPLKPWIRLIKWAKDAFSSEAKSKLIPLLQLCTKTFLTRIEYYNDFRYLRIWVRYADCCSDPLKVFATMEEKQIGYNHSLFYEAYGVELEMHKDFSKANDIYLLGLVRQAQPLDQLEKTYRGFLKRKEKLVKHQPKRNTSIKSACQPQSTLPNTLETSALSQYSFSKDSMSQVSQSAISDSQQALDILVDQEHARDVKTTGKLMSHPKVPEPKSCFDKATLSFDGTNLEDKGQAVHALKIPEGVEMNFEELREVSWTAPQNESTDHVKRTEAVLPDILPGSYDHGACQPFAKNVTGAATLPQSLNFNGVETSRRGEMLHLNKGYAPNETESLDFSKASPPIACKGGTATVRGSGTFEGQSGRTCFSSRKPLHFHGEETIAIKKFVDVAVASRIDTEEGNSERHDGLIDPTITTKEAMADILSLFNKPLPFEPCRKKKAPAEPILKRESHEEPQGFSVLADDCFNNSDSVAKSKTSKEMDFVVLVDDDLKEPSRRPTALDSSTNIIPVQDEKCQMRKSEKRTGIHRGLANKTHGGLSSQNINIGVYVGDHLKPYITSDAKQKDKENVSRLADLQKA